MKWIDLIIGHGEIGTALGHILKESTSQQLFQDPAKAERILKTDYAGLDRSDSKVVMHVCIPYTTKFVTTVVRYIQQFRPDATIVHSTVLPGTTKRLHASFTIKEPIYYSPVRGQHVDLVRDLNRYTKYFAQGAEIAQQRFIDAGIKTAVVADDLTLEWAKHLSNTLYYHWIIGYRQHVHRWAQELNINENDMWGFTKELHEYTGIQYPTYLDPKGIGGHCVLQNSKLLLHNGGMPRSMKKVLRALIALNDEIAEGG